MKTIYVWKFALLWFRNVLEITWFWTFPELRFRNALKICRIHSFRVLGSEFQWKSMIGLPRLTSSYLLLPIPLLVRPHVIANFYFSRFSWFSWRDFKQNNYYFWEASKDNLLSKCSTQGYYIFTKSCILKPPKSSSFWGLKSLQENVENLENS